MIGAARRSGSFGQRRRAPAALLLACAVATWIPWDAVPAEPAATGRLEGRVVVGPQLSSRQMRFSLYPDARRARLRHELREDADELANVVIYLEEVPEGPGSPRPSGARPRMDQADLSFEPHTLAVVKGTTVEFPNRDTLFHNVFSLSRAASFDLGRYPNGESRSVRFDRPGVVKVFCHIHSDMSAVILVLDNPWFSSPRPDGSYSIEGIPPGEYSVVGWHERARPTRRTVRIDAGGTARLDFAIPLTDGAAGG